MNTAEKLVKTMTETAEIRVYTAQIKMLTDLYDVIHRDGDLRDNLHSYIKRKEKEIGYE